MNVLQVELAKANKQVLKVVRKIHHNTTRVDISRTTDSIYVHVYSNYEHVHMYGSYGNCTTKQLIARIKSED
jgi:hypothetical protein